MPFLDGEASSSRNRGRASSTNSNTNKGSRIRQSISAKRKSPTKSDNGMDKETSRTLSPISTTTMGDDVPTVRKVRTKPPSAMYEPPSPPPPERLPLPPTGSSHTRNPTAGSGMTTSTMRKRPRMRIRYSTSESSDGDEEGSSDDDEEPPWWTFTQRGMMKMKARSMRRREGGTRSGRAEGSMGDGMAGGSATEGGPSQGRPREGSFNRDMSGGVRRTSREKAEQRQRRTSKDPTSDRPRSRRSSKEHDSSRRGSRDKDGERLSSSTCTNKRHSAQDYFSSHQAFQKRLSHQDVSPGGSAESTPTHHRRLGVPLPIRQSLFERRISGRGDPDITLQPPTAMAMQRSNSAPTSPRPLGVPLYLDTHSNTTDIPSPGTITLVAEPEHDHTLTLTRPSNDQAITSNTSIKVPTPPTSSRRLPIPKRQLTAPQFPKFLRPFPESQVQTDTETGPTPSPRLRARRRLTHLTGRGSHGPEGETPDSGTDPELGGSRTRRNRQGTSRLRLNMNIPPPISQHFSHGWPHAGSWQDALYGYYGEDGNGTGSGSGSGTGSEQERVRARRGSGERLGNGRRLTTHSSPLKNRIVPIREGVPLPVGEIAEESPGLGERPGSPHTPRQPTPAVKKPRRQKVRRYRTALIPPTPAGLGFTPTGREPIPAWKEGRVDTTGEEGFDWGDTTTTGQGRVGDVERNGGFTEKGDRAKSQGKKGYWWIFGKSKAQGESDEKGRMGDENFKKRLRRYIFLDARVTVWIRLINLAVVIALLALSVRIRMELDELEVPGLMGSSTTLIIAYSSLTILHNLTAIYREYTGKPIGLWDLRSKMLWVCLDLLFIALWSSAMSLSTNDYIGTPLQCTSTSPWWRDGLPDAYAQSLESLKLINTSPNAAEFYKVSNVSITPSSMISHTLSVVLPLEVVGSELAGQACRRQVGCIALSLLALGLYGGNMVLSLFRIFETVRRSANLGRAVMV